MARDDEPTRPEQRAIQPPPRPGPKPAAPAPDPAHERFERIESAIDSLAKAITSTQVIRITTPLPSPGSLFPPPPGAVEPRPSLAVKAAGASKAGARAASPWVIGFLAITGALAWIGQFVTRPEYGAIVQLLKIFATFLAAHNGVTPYEGTPVREDGVTEVRPSVERAEDLVQDGQGGQRGQDDARQRYGEGGQGGHAR